ncbi:MAG TPA: hypothetical protein VET90_02700, partial [Candidatus Binatus sp.]|nr:hypothetical protein [Candidatus Binatus sp.]
GDRASAGRNNHNNHDNRAGACAGEGGLGPHGSCAVYVVIGLARTFMGLRAPLARFAWFSRLFEHLKAELPAPRGTDPIAAALAFAIREAVQLEAGRLTLPLAPNSAKVVAMNAKRGTKVA